MLKRALAIVAVAGCTTVAGAQTGATTAFVGAALVDGTGGPVVPNAVILVRDGRIVDAGPSARVQVPPGALRIDLQGKTLLPGFISAHAHATDTSGLQTGAQFNTRENVVRQLALYAKYGVTSVFSLGGDGPAGFAVRDEPALGRSRLFVAGRIVTATTPAAAAEETAALMKEAPDWVKIRVDDNLGTARKMPLDAATEVIARAHAAGRPVAAHIFYLEDAKALLRAGVDLIAHSVRDLPVDQELIRLLRDRNVCVVPTLTREVSAFVYESTPPFFADAFFLAHAERATIEALKEPARQQQVRESASAQRYKVALEQASRNVKTLRDAGVRIAMGTDTGPPARFQGYFEHMELELMVKAGLTPMQAIVAATADAAHCMKAEGQIGSIRRGAWADLLVFAANPADDIRATRTLERVYVGGVAVPLR